MQDGTGTCYDLEMLAKMELKLELTYLKMLKFSLAVTRRDKIKNEYISGTDGIDRFGDKVREAKL